MNNLEKWFQSIEKSRLLRCYDPFWSFHQFVKKVGVSKIQEEHVYFLAKKFKMSYDKVIDVIEERIAWNNKVRSQYIKNDLTANKKEFQRNVNKEDLNG